MDRKGGMRRQVIAELTEANDTAQLFYPHLLDGLSYARLKTQLNKWRL
jgi:hypothetical protein